MRTALTALIVTTLLGAICLVPATAAEAYAEARTVETVAAFTEHLQAGQFTEAWAMFSPEVQAALPADKLEAVWASLPANYGSLSKVSKPYAIPSDSGLTLRQEASFAKSPLDLLYMINSNGEITTFQIVPRVAKESFFPSETRELLEANPETALETAATFTKLLQAGKYAEARQRLAPAAQAVMTADQLEGEWTSLPASNGSITKVDDPFILLGSTEFTIRQAVYFEKAPQDLLYMVNSNLEITTFRFVPHVPKERFFAADDAPAYVEPGSFLELELTFGTEKYPLGATLTLPQMQGPFPAVVLVPGSGASDRNEAVGPNKVFQDIAWGLASQGIAVFRFDKRTYVHGAKIPASEMNLENESIIDSKLAVQLLKQKPFIGKVFVVGHSLGGSLAPIIAEQAEADGFVSLAGSPRPLYELMPEQTAYLSQLDGDFSSSEKAAVEAMVADVKRIEAGEVSPDEIVMGVPANYWLDAKTKDPLASARTFSRPMLFLQGERDYQVLASKDLERWKQGLADVADVTTKVYPGLNHLFIKGEGPGNPGEYLTPGHVDGAVITDIAAWIKAH